MQNKEASPQRARRDSQRDQPLQLLSNGNQNWQEFIMLTEDFRKLLSEVEEQLRAGKSVAILGLTSITDRLISSLRQEPGLLQMIEAIYDHVEKESRNSHLDVPLRPLRLLEQFSPEVLVVADDMKKEDLLRTALPYIRGFPKIIIVGYGHFLFRDPVFYAEQARLSVPSLANGYPNTLVHLYQCLQNALRLKLTGVVVELGMFRGGTTMFLSRIIERLGAQWRVLGFDTFAGFPPQRSPLDMYDHEDLHSNDLGAAQDYLKNRDVEIIDGDIVETCSRLKEEDLVVTFFDTDNYSPARAALEIVQERTVVGGAIVFDHFTGVDRFRYTLGERMAGSVLLNDTRYFHLHDTGVFYRQC